MAKIIDAEQIMDRLNAVINYGVAEADGKHDISAEFLLSFLERLPAVDAVEVVRCKDCAVPHNRMTGCPKLGGLVTPPDWYCPAGERKEVPVYG